MKETIEELLEKLYAYEKLEDVVNRRKTLDSIIEQYPGSAKAWYEKARLLSGDFKENLSPSEEFYRCISNIEKLDGEDSELLKEYESYREAVKKEQERIEKEKEESKIRDKEIKKKNIKILIPVIFGIIILMYFTSPKSYKDEETMKFAMRGTYSETTNYDLLNSKYSKQIEVFDTAVKIRYGMSSNAAYHTDNSDSYTIKIKKWNYRRGYIRLEGGTKIYLKNGKLIYKNKAYSRGTGQF